MSKLTALTVIAAHPLGEVPMRLARLDADALSQALLRAQSSYVTVGAGLDEKALQLGLDLVETADGMTHGIARLGQRDRERARLAFRRIHAELLKLQCRVLAGRQAIAKTHAPRDGEGYVIRRWTEAVETVGAIVTAEPVGEGALLMPCGEVAEGYEEWISPNLELPW
jgi:hypothetical protein